MTKFRWVIILGLCLGAVFNGAYSQSYTPVPITGFNNDVIAEAGTDATLVTSCVIDGTQHVMYSQAFSAINGITGGILNSGTIVNGNYTWQLDPLAGHKALYLSTDPT